MKYLLISLFWIIFAQGQDIADEKCEEYAKAVYQEDSQILTLRNRGRNKVTSTCAIYENPLIVGGTPARTREFPHMAVIGFGPSEDSDMDWFCGGTLISEQHVLTAAHCTVSQSGPPQKVRLGTINLEENDDYVQEVVIERFLNHPQYKRPVKYHDIAILFLSEVVEFSAFVRPACLNTIEEVPYNTAIATGFGKKSYEGEEGSPILLKVDLDIIPNDECAEYMEFREREMPQQLIKEMLCAGHLKGGRDTCQGDSGGPLQVALEEPYCMYSVIGVTSFGKFCGMEQSPGIYTKVDQYIPWIESTIWM